MRPASCEPAADWRSYEGARTGAFLDLRERIHVWRLDLDNVGSDIGHNLSDDETARAERCRRPLDRRRFVAARSVLRCLLADMLDRGEAGKGASLRFDYTPTGKPFLRDDPSLRFNLSHSEGLAVIAATRSGEVGVDVERLRPIADMEKIARLVFTAAERAVLTEGPPAERDAVFYRIWTRKEALGKARGVGLGAPRDPDTAGFMVTPLPSLVGYAGALAASCSAHGTRFWTWPAPMSEASRPVA